MRPARPAQGFTRAAPGGSRRAVLVLASVKSVPETDLYGFTVGTRDARVVHSLSEMRSQNWTVAGSVG